MDEIEARTVTLDPETAASIDRKVASGAYDSQEQVVKAGLEALESEEEHLERFIREEVLPVYDHIKANPDDVLTSEEVGRRLDARYAQNIEKAS